MLDAGMMMILAWDSEGFVICREFIFIDRVVLNIWL